MGTASDLTLGSTSCLVHQGKMLALSEPMLPHPTMGMILGPPLEVKGSFGDIMNVKWLAQGT